LPHEKTKTKTFPTREKTKTLNKAFQLEDKVSRSWGKREGEPSAEVCDRLSRTRVSSQRQLPTDHDYAVPTREYQLDQSSPLPASAAADPALVRKNNQRTLTGHYISTSGLPTIRPKYGPQEVRGYISESRIPIRRTWNTEIIEALKPEAGDIALYKTRYSGFYQTDLDSTLKNLGARFLIVTGCTTSVCVESTIRDAMFRDYSPILLSDCTAEPQGYGLPRSNHEASLFIIRDNFGWLPAADHFIRTIEHA